MKVFRACLVLCLVSALAPAQDSSQDSQNDSATVQAPQPPPPPPRAETMTLRLTGSFLLDRNAAMAGHVEAVALDPVSAQVRFAMVSLGYPSNRVVVTPIPWSLLEHYFDAREGGGMPGTYQRFRAPFDLTTLWRAPRVNTELQGRTNDAAWIAASTAYFAALTSLASVGGAGTASGIQAGGASGGAAAVPATATDAVADTSSGYGSPFWVGGGGGGVPTTLAEFLQLGTNLFGPGFLATVNTNVFVTNNFLNTNLLSALTNFFGTNVFAFTNGRNPDFFGTNGFALTPFGSNFFRTNRFAGTAVTNNPFANPGLARRLSERGVVTNAPAPAPPPAGTETIPAAGTAGTTTGTTTGTGTSPAPTPPPAGTEPVGNTRPGAPAPTPPPAGVERVPPPVTPAPTIPSTPRR